MIELLRDSNLGSAGRRRLRGSVLAAPELIDLEVLSALSRLLRAGRISRRAASAALVSFDRLAIIRFSHRPLRDGVWRLRERLSVYDASYVALAQRLDSRVLTTDARLASGAPRGRVELVTA